MAKTVFEPLPHREAIAYFRSKGYAPEIARFHHLDHFREDHARNWVVAKAVRDDVSEAIREEFDRAFSEGQTLAQFQKDLKPKLEKLGWWGKSIQRDPVTGELTEVQLGSMRRLRTIFDTNMRTAHAAGHWARIQRTKSAFPYLEYVQIERPSKRHDHARFHGLIRPVDDPVWLRIYPPNGYFCGCMVRQLTEGQLQRQGKTVSEPLDLQEEPWTNKRTGETFGVPAGVHPGFDSNPGAVWLDIGAEWEAMTPDLSAERRATERGLIAGLRLRQLGEGREALVVTDANSVPFFLRSATKAAPDKVEMEGVIAPKGASFLHSHLTDASLSTADLNALFDHTGHAMVAVAPGGSLWRITRAQGVSVRDQLGVYSAAIFPAFTAELKVTANGAEVFAHARLLWLEKKGVITYSWHMSERVRQIMDAHRDLIDRLSNV